MLAMQKEVEIAAAKMLESELEQEVVPVCNVVTAEAEVATEKLIEASVEKEEYQNVILIIIETLVDETEDEDED